MNLTGTLISRKYSRSASAFAVGVKVLLLFVQLRWAADQDWGTGGGGGMRWPDILKRESDGTIVAGLLLFLNQSSHRIKQAFLKMRLSLVFMHKFVFLSLNSIQTSLSISGAPTTICSTPLPTLFRYRDTMQHSRHPPLSSEHSYRAILPYSHG